MEQPSLLNKIWKWIVGAFLVITGLFLVERSKRKQAEAELETSEFKTEDKVLAEKQKQQEEKIAADKAKLDQLRTEHDQATEDNSQDLSPEQVEEYWKRRNNSN